MFKFWQCNIVLLKPKIFHERKKIMFNFLKSNKDEVKTEVTLHTTAKTEESADTVLPFTDIRPQWKELANKKAVSSSDMAALCIYRSLVKGQGKEGAIGRLQKAFRPITSPIKLKNGVIPHMAVKFSLYSVGRSTVVEWLTKEELSALVTMAQEIAKEWEWK
jgi:hypothetical protein